MPGLLAARYADDAPPASPTPTTEQHGYVLARGSDYYGIWAGGSPVGEALERFPPTAAGWYAARGRVKELAHPVAELDLSPILSPRTNRPTVIAAVTILLGVVSGVAGLFPAYLGGVNLISQVSQLLPHVAYLVGWAIAAALLLVDRRFGRGAGGLGVGVSIVGFGFLLTDVLTAAAMNSESPGAGLYLSLAGWIVATIGSSIALFALRSPTPAGGPVDWRHPLVFLGGIAALGAAVAFALPWDRYTLTAASSGSTQSSTAGDVFANPGAIISGNVVTMVLIVIVVIVAIAWRPGMVGVSMLAGALVPLGAQVFATLAQSVPALSAFGVTSAQAAAGRVSVAGSYTGWFYLYCAFVATLVVLAGWVASSTSPEPTPEAARLR